MTTIHLSKLVAAAALAALAIPATAALAAGDAAAGKQTYTMFCASCHGDGGKGDGPVGQVLQPPPRDFTDGDFKFDTNEDGTPGTDDDLMAVITNGAEKYGGSAQMAPWNSLSETDRQNLVAFIRSLKQ